jgi:hypothetical protein
LAKAMMSSCGLDCGGCEFHTGVKQPGCAGCTEIKGKPFWGACPTYACVQEHNAKHCGACGEFPCAKFISAFDPNDPEGQRSAVYRAGVEAYRTRHGDEKAAELIRKTTKPHS